MSGRKRSSKGKLPVGAVTKTLTPIKTMKCPVHDYPIEVISVPGRQYAICSCPVRDKHSGRVVWEHLDITPPKNS
jgi:hypothetical protein